MAASIGGGYWSGDGWRHLLAEGIGGGGYWPGGGYWSGGGYWPGGGYWWQVPWPGFVHAPRPEPTPGAYARFRDRECLEPTLESTPRPPEFVGSLSLLPQEPCLKGGPSQGRADGHEVDTRWTLV
jgi:hypothetical protein